MQKLIKGKLYKSVSKLQTTYLGRLPTQANIY